MTPIPPLSVKFPDEERSKLKALATTLGWPESQIVRDAVAHVLRLIHQPHFTEAPKLVILSRLALGYEQNPASVQQPKKHRCSVSPCSSKSVGKTLS